MLTSLAAKWAGKLVRSTEHLPNHTAEARRLFDWSDWLQLQGMLGLWRATIAGSKISDLRRCYGEANRLPMLDRNSANAWWSSLNAIYRRQKIGHVERFRNDFIHACRFRMVQLLLSGVGCDSSQNCLLGAARLAERKKKSYQ